MKQLLLTAGLAVLSLQAMAGDLLTKPDNAISDIAITEATQFKEGCWLRIKSNKPLSYSTLTLSKPNRLVLDFSNTRYQSPLDLELNNLLVSGIRGLQRENWLYRLVVDSQFPLKAVCQSQLTSANDYELNVLLVSAVQADSMPQIDDHQCHPVADVPKTDAKSADVKTTPSPSPRKNWYLNRNDEVLSESLKRWAQREGWQLVWESERDFPVEVDVQFSGSFNEAIEQVLSTLLVSDYPLQALINQEARVIRITRYLQPRGRL